MIIVSELKVGDKVTIRDAFNKTTYSGKIAKITSKYFYVLVDFLIPDTLAFNRKTLLCKENPFRQIELQ